MAACASLPTAFESLAAINKFIAVQKVSPEFYSKHWNAAEFACAFLRTVANFYPPIERAFRAALPVSIREGAVPIEHAIRSGGLPSDKIEWFDSQMTEVLKQLVPVVRDTELPDWLTECKWAIEGAFE